VFPVLLALAASLFYGVSDYLGGLKSRALPLLVVLVLSQVAGLLALVAIVAVVGDAFPARDYALYAIGAGLFEAVAIAAFYRGLAVGKMSVVAPVTATSPVVAVLASIALGEHPAALQWVGIALALGGVALISLGEGDEDGSGAATSIRASVVLGLAAAMTFGGYQVAIDAASEGGVPWALLLTRATSVAVFGAAFLAVRPKGRATRSDLPALAAVGLLIVAADSAFAVATTKGVLAVVGVLASLYPVVTIGLARVYLGERLERIQLAGVVACVGGVVAISAA
jgi:drug/metabolite transporter (DMT)-like permease